MTVHQISVFVENKSGTLLKVLDLFKEAGIQLIASTISDTVEYGIYRIICSEPARALKALKDAGISADESDVFAITLDNYPDSTWTFIDSKTSVKQEGYVPPIIDFALRSLDTDEDVTQQILDDEGSYENPAGRMSLRKASQAA